MGIYLGLSLCGSPQELRGRREFAFFSFLRRPFTEVSPRARYLQCPPSSVSALFCAPFPSGSLSRPFLPTRSPDVRLNARVSADIPRVTGRCPSATATTIAQPLAAAATAAAAAAKTKRNYFT